VRRYIHRSRNQIRRCYDAALAKNPGIAGKLVVDFTISGNGKVTATRASGLDADVEACVAAVIAAIEFPAPTGNAPLNISYPFVFQAAGN
jgi:outer membrane biosynthesis protein TonB